MQISLDDLALVVAIADHGSFTAAGLALGSPKSTISRRLSDLEIALETTLFHRSTRALSLTNEGRHIYETAKPAIDAAQSAARLIGARNKSVAGRVSLTTTAAIGEYLVAPRLPALIEQYPDLQIDLQLSEARVNIVGDGVDIAIRMGQLSDSELTARRLATIKRTLVASPGYFATHGQPRQGSEFSAHRLIITSVARTTLHSRHGVEHEIAWQINAGNMLVARRLALAGTGLALLPDYLIADDLAAGRLSAAENDQFGDVIDAWIVTSRQRYRSPAVRAVMDALANMGLSSK